MLIRLAEEFGFKIATFQHVLEGYRVATRSPPTARAPPPSRTGGPTRSRPIDAIPYNAALMARKGVVVSINSDSAEEARHLNQEAAKAMKYGGLTEDEALALVTLNPRNSSASTAGSAPSTRGRTPTRYPRRAHPGRRNRPFRSDPDLAARKAATPPRDSNQSGAPGEGPRPAGGGRERRAGGGGGAAGLAGGRHGQRPVQCSGGGHHGRAGWCRWRVPICPAAPCSSPPAKIAAVGKEVSISPGAKGDRRQGERGIPGAHRRAQYHRSGSAR